jgi:quercetin dioxygenase-like cupin family protein
VQHAERGLPGQRAIGRRGIEQRSGDRGRAGEQVAVGRAAGGDDCRLEELARHAVGELVLELAGARVQGGEAGGGGTFARGGQQARLPDSRGPLDHQQPCLPARRPGEQIVDHGKLARALEQCGGRTRCVQRAHSCAEHMRAGEPARGKSTTKDRGVYGGGSPSRTHPRAREAPLMDTKTLATPHGELLHLPTNAGATFWGPGDVYRFLVTGAESGGSYFAMEAIVPPGGGPPPHIHRREDETFYVIEGEFEFRLGDDTVTARAGDFVNVPRHTVHCFHNASEAVARMILTFSPAGIEKWFEETLERALDPTQPPPDNIDEVVARYVAAAPRYGIEFV